MSYQTTDLSFRSKVVFLALAIFSLSAIALAEMTTNASHIGRQPMQQTTCTGSFGGTWLPVSANPPIAGQLTISLNGTSASGNYVLGKTRRTLNGSISGNSLKGDWVITGVEFSGGTFESRMFNDNKLEVTFYSNNQEVDRTYWECQIAQSQPSPQAPLPSSVPTEYDNDNFRSFDALPKQQQMLLLSHYGPRLPREYNWNDLSLRAFVRGGLPIVFDYFLDSDTPTEVDISIATARPFRISLKPSERTRVQITLPDDFGSELDVGRMRILAGSSNGKSPDFRLFGIGMGERGVQALRKLDANSSRMQLAMLGVNLDAGGYERPPLLAPKPVQDGPTIDFDQPTTIKAKQKPEQNVKFRITLNSDFSNGSWKFFKVIGYGSTRHVWNRPTDHISAGQAVSGQWNGVVNLIGPLWKKASKGDHQLHLTTWIGPDANADWDILTTFQLITIQ